MENCAVRILNEKKCLFELFQPSEVGFVQNHRTYLITADSREDMNQWVEAINKSVGPENKISFHDDPRDIIRQGWLVKMGGRRKTWKKRWFVLTDKTMTLFYFRTEKVNSNFDFSIFHVEQRFLTMEFILLRKKFLWE
jgi:hypothetical protein